MNLEDLQIEKDIIPMFDDHLNNKSREALFTIFYTIGNSLASIINQQQIIQSFVDHSTFRSISSFRRDIEEVFAYTQSIDSSDGEILKKTISTMKFQLMLDKKYRSQLISKAIQFGYLLNRLYSLYFRELRLNTFPTEYAGKVRGMIRCLDSFEKLYGVEDFESGNADVRAYYRLLQEVYVQSLSGNLQNFWSDFFTFDAYVSISNTIRRRKFVMPVFIEQGIKIDNLYHPNLENPVKTSIQNNAGVILLTGPNMSGKSTFLKAISICIYLAHIGLAVPADYCSIPYFQELNIRLNSRDDLGGGLSHFMSELKNIKALLLEAHRKRRVFAVLDEMFSGTNVDDGQELFKTTITGLSSLKGCLFFISTHFGNLKEYFSTRRPSISAYHLDASISNGIPHFSFQVKAGWSDHRFGQLLFQMEGLPQLLTTNTPKS